MVESFQNEDACVERDPYVRYDPAATQAARQSVKDLLSIQPELIRLGENGNWGRRRKNPFWEGSIAAIYRLFPILQKSHDLIFIYSPGMRDFE